MILRNRILALTTVAFIFVEKTSAQNYETGDNSTVKGCTTHCSYKDSDLSCWNSTLYFFEHILLGHMRHYVAVQVNVDQWKRRHQKPYAPDFENMRQDSIDRLLSRLQPDDVVSNKTITTIITTLMARVEQKSDHIISWTPHYSCPLPCEYRYSTWRNLFVVSLIVNVCLLSAIFPYAMRMTRQYRGEALL